MKTFTRFLLTALVLLATIAVSCASPESAKKSQYVKELEKAGIPEACKEVGIDFQNSFVAPYEKAPLDGGTLLSLLFRSFGEEDILFVSTAWPLYQRGFFSNDDLKTLAASKWQEDDAGFSFEWCTMYAIARTRGPSPTWEYYEAPNMLPGERPKPQTILPDPSVIERLKRIYPLCVPPTGTTPYPSSLAALLLATGSDKPGYMGLVLQPETASANVGNSHTVAAEAWLWTQDGIPICRLPGQKVDFSVSGSHSLNSSVTTDADGRASFAYTGTKEGEDTILVSATVGGHDLEATATVTWQRPVVMVSLISLEPPNINKMVGQEYELLATVTKDDKPASGAEVCFKIIAGSAHCPVNLLVGESYDVEYGQPENQEAKISEHWKKEKVYSATNNWVYCSTTGASGKAKLTLGGIKAGTDNLLVTATTAGSYVEAPAAITWTAPVTPIRTAVVYPNGGESWQEGSTQTITWTSSGISGAATINIELSRDDGINWTTIIANTPNDGSQPWPVTGPTTFQARIRVSSGIVSDTSDGDFTIMGSETVMPPLQGPFHEEFFSWAGMSEPTFTGAPILVRDERNINYDWGEMAPTWGVGTDYFLARWMGMVDFAAGTYTFRARADDGIRLWVDGNLLIDEWRPQVVTEFTVTRSLTAGQHEIKVEYFERMGLAICQVSWQKQP